MRKACVYFVGLPGGLGSRRHYSQFYNRVLASASSVETRKKVYRNVGSPIDDMMEVPGIIGILPAYWGNTRGRKSGENYEQHQVQID